MVNIIKATQRRTVHKRRMEELEITRYVDLRKTAEHVDLREPIEKQSGNSPGGGHQRQS